MDNASSVDENATNETSDTGHTPFRSKNEVFVFMALYVLLSLLVITGNTLVIVAFKNVRRRAAINMFFVSLAISDLLVGAVSIPLWIYNLSCPSFNSCIKPSVPVSVFYQAFDVFSAMASISNLVAISVERYFAICWPVQHRMSSFTRYYVMIFATWSYSMVITAVYLVNFNSTWKSYRGSLVFVAGFAVPLLIISIMYSSIHRSVRSMNAHWKRTNAKSSMLRRRVQREKRTSMTVAIVTVLFIVAWLPFFVVSMLWTFHRSSLLVGSGFIRLMDFIKWMHYSNSAVNPVVYAYRSEEIRRMLFKLPARVTGRREGIPGIIQQGNGNN
ncbi:histamine H2 receptor-like [Oculina patagonica]